MSDAIIRSRTNPLVKRLRALKERASGTDLALLEGFTLVEEALAAGASDRGGGAHAARGRDSPRGRERDAAARRRAASPCASSTRPSSASLSETETSQGLLALARRPAFDEERRLRRPAR